MHSVKENHNANKINANKNNDNDKTENNIDKEEIIEKLFNMMEVFTQRILKLENQNHMTNRKAI